MFEGSVGMLDWSRILFSAFVESYIYPLLCSCVVNKREST